MGVVSDVVTDGACEPISNEALAAAEPVKLVRPPRRISVICQYAQDVFIATSAEIRVSRQRLGA